MLFHENLKAYRKKKGYTQETLAIKLNVVRQTVSKWEKGLSVPDAGTLLKLAEVLDTSVSELLGADSKETSGDRNEMAEQLAVIAEQLAIRNRRSRRILKGFLVIVIALVVLFAATAILSYSSYSRNTVAGKTEWLCTLDGDEYVYGIEYNSNYQVLISGGDAYIDNYVFTYKSDDANQFAAQLKLYFEERGGTVVVQTQSGLALYE